MQKSSPCCSTPSDPMRPSEQEASEITQLQLYAKVQVYLVETRGGSNRISSLLTKYRVKSHPCDYPSVLCRYEYPYWNHSGAHIQRNGLSASSRICDPVHSGYDRKEESLFALSTGAPASGVVLQKFLPDKRCLHPE